MGDVHDRTGRKVGSVNAWSGVYNAYGNKVGSINIFSSEVFDAAGNLVGKAYADGEVYDTSRRLLCKVPFFGSDVQDAKGNTIGGVGIAGAPEPPPDMQWRGAAALLLLCRDVGASTFISTPTFAPVSQAESSKWSLRGCLEILAILMAALFMVAFLHGGITTGNVLFLAIGIILGIVIVAAFREWMHKG